jgi:RNA polymerase sigma-70 factor (ECF subfamily)
MPLPETNHALIARLKRPEDELAWQDFAAAYEPFLFRLLLRRGLAETDARDVMQLILLNVCRSLHRWSPDGQERSFRRWLSGLSRNTLLKFLRHQKLEPRGHGGSDFLLAQTELPELIDATDQERQDYEREIFRYAAELVQREFRPASWHAFQTTAIEGRSVDDVAAELKVERGAIYMSRSRIMARIRQKVRELSGE